MARRLAAIGVVFLLLGAQAPIDAQATKLEAVAAFARLYGVVRYFYPSDAAATLDWDRLAVLGVSEVLTTTEPLPQTLQRFFAQVGPEIVVSPTLPRVAAMPADASMVAWEYAGPGIEATANPTGPYLAFRTNRSRPPFPPGLPAATPAGATRTVHAEFDLTRGVRARVATAFSDAEAAAPPPDLARLQQRLATLDPDLDGEARRFADVVVAWNVFRHFYPYASEAGVDWDALLVGALTDAAAAKTRADRARGLRRLVAGLQDGHGNVIDQVDPPRGALPLAFRVLSGKLIVTASAIPDQVPIGAEVTAIDDQPSAVKVADEMLLASGTPQWRRTITARRMSSCVRAATVRLTVTAAGASRSVPVPCTNDRWPEEPRPPSVTEIRPRTWYVDLTRAQWKDFYAVLSKLVIADGIVFDVRGYPTDSGFSLLPSLVAQPDHDTWMHVPTIVGPFYQVGAWRSFSWNVQPRSPRLVSPIVVLTDERAISYAESVLGHVADHQLATIIGGVTAGANGNIVRFTVPGQFMFIFTGMRVTGHDGSRQHHGVGITPDIALEPSLESIAAGRDDLLERALAVLAARKR